MFIDKTILDSKEIPGYIKDFLLHLVQYADERGVCYPSQETLGNRMGKSTRMIRYYIRYCVELKLIAVKHKWLRANTYTILCGKKVELSTNRKSVSYRTDHLNIKQRSASQERLNSKEIKICLEDSKSILGESVFTRNKNWLRLMILKAGYDTYQQCLEWLKTALLMAQVDGSPINSPSGLLTWRVRQFVML